MVLFIDEALVSKINVLPNYNVFIQKLMLNYSEGKHLVIISPKNVKSILDNGGLDSFTENYLRHYFSHNKGALSSLSLFNRVIKIVPSISDETSYTDMLTKKEFVCIEMQRFLDTANFQKTILLGENGSDIKVYALMAEFYRRESKLLSFKINFKGQGGGGSTISKEYETIHNSKEDFCFCLMDSDRKNPDMCLGDTAKKVVEFSEKNFMVNFKCSYFVIDVLELENLLPKSFYVNYYENFHLEKKGGIDKLEKLQGIDKKSINYFDFKNGLGSLGKITDESVMMYWYDLISRSNIKCDICIDSHALEYGYIKGYGDNILVNFLKLKENDSFYFINLDKKIKNKWLELGEILSSYLFSHDKIRAI